VRPGGEPPAAAQGPDPKPRRDGSGAGGGCVVTKGQPDGEDLAEHTRLLREHARALDEDTRALTRHARAAREHGKQLAEAAVHGRVFTQINNEAAQSVRDLQAELDQFSGGGGLVSALAETRDVLGEFNTSVGKLEALADGEAAGR
jgi:hypothetical protein